MSDYSDIANFFEADDFDESMLFDLTIPDNTNIDPPHTFEGTREDEFANLDLLLDAGNPTTSDTDVLQAETNTLIIGEQKTAVQAYSQDITNNVSFNVDNDISKTGQIINTLDAFLDEDVALPVAQSTPRDIHQLFNENEILQAALTIAQKNPVLSAQEGMYGKIQNSHPQQWQPLFQNTNPFELQRSFEFMPIWPTHRHDPVFPNNDAGIAFPEFHYTDNQSIAATQTGESIQQTYERSNSAARVTDQPPAEAAREDSENSSGPSSQSSSGFLAKPILHTKEKPKADPSRPHVRINKTSGPSFRSSKMNNYNPKKHYSKHKGNVFANWTTSAGKHIEYNEIGELSEPALSTGQIKRFIYEHAAFPGKRMVLWIQRCPADSARRYHSAASPKCRFWDCPDFKRTIMPGHLRVVFDEKWTTHGDKQDPFHFAGTAHLYCIERFLNLPEICQLQNIDVRAETRPMPKESEARNKAALSGDDAKIALSFIDACRKGRLSEKFPDYPKHKSGGKGKDYELTLSYAMQLEINSHRAERGRTNFRRHNGDLEKYNNVRVAAVHSVKGMKRKALDDTLDAVYDEARSPGHTDHSRSSTDGRPLEQCKKLKLANYDNEVQDNDLGRARPRSRDSSVFESQAADHQVAEASSRKRQHSDIENDSEAERCKRVKIA